MKLLPASPHLPAAAAHCLHSAVCKGESHVPAHPRALLLLLRLTGSQQTAEQLTWGAAWASWGAQLVPGSQGPHLDHTRSGLAWPFRGQKRQSGTPKYLEEQVRCCVSREIYTRVFLYTGDVVTQWEVRATSNQVPCPKIRLKLFN